MRYENIIDSIGNTPLVKINKVVPDGCANIYVKLESSNPGSSVKDRIGASMIKDAEEKGLLKQGMTIIEPTSGNTGIAIAMVAASKGYQCVLVMPDTMSMERRMLLKFFGTELILTPGAEGMKGAIAKANDLTKVNGNFQPSQFDNPSNPAIHAKTTGPEIIKDMAELHLDAFVSGVGTGGTVSGAGKVLKDHFGCKIYAVEPKASPVLSGGEPGPHPIQGIGGGFIPGNYDKKVVDEVITVENDIAFEIAKKLARKDGILCGISSGANIWAAIQVGQKLGPGKNVVTIVCDSGERYLSTALFE